VDRSIRAGHLPTPQPYDAALSSGEPTIAGTSSQMLLPSNSGCGLPIIFFGATVDLYVSPVGIYGHKASFMRSRMGTRNWCASSAASRAAC
jgi:hypothetical protein